MKKFLGIVMVLAGSAYLLYLDNNSLNKLLIQNIALDNIEAVAECEVTNKRGKVLLKCTGSDSCSTTYMGHTLTCDGTKVSL